jgi:hypothetical protein
VTSDPTYVGGRYDTSPPVEHPNNKRKEIGCLEKQCRETEKYAVNLFKLNR